MMPTPATLATDHAAPPQSAADTALVRQLGLWDAVAIYVGIVFGSGIFVAPAAVSAAAPGFASAMLLWVAGGFIAACGAFCYAEAAIRLPRTGGFYVFYLEAYGEPVAQVAGWAALLLTYPAALAGISLVFGEYLGRLVPALGGVPVVLAGAAIAASGLLNVLGVRTGAWSQRLLTGLKVAALVVLCAAALLGDGSSAPDTAGAFEIVPDLALFAGALVLVAWTYDGWSDVTMIAGELKHPGRSLSRSVLLSAVVLVVLYAGVQFAVGALLPSDQAAASSRVFADAAEVGLGPGAGRLVSLLIVVSTFGAINGMVITSSRLAWALAHDHALPGWFARVSPNRHVPWRAVVGVVTVATLFLFAADFRDIVGWFSFAVWIYYGLGVIALLQLRRRQVGEPVAWRAPGGWLPPAVILLTSAAVVASEFAHAPRRSLFALGLLLAGYPVQRMWSRWRLRREG